MSLIIKKMTVFCLVCVTAALASPIQSPLLENVRSFHDVGFSYPSFMKHSMSKRSAYEWKLTGKNEYEFEKKSFDETENDWSYESILKSRETISYGVNGYDYVKKIAYPQSDNSLALALIDSVFFEGGRIVKDISYDVASNGPDIRLYSYYNEGRTITVKFYKNQQDTAYWLKDSIELIDPAAFDLNYFDESIQYPNLKGLYFITEAGGVTTYQYITRFESECTEKCLVFLIRNGLLNQTNADTTKWILHFDSLNNIHAEYFLKKNAISSAWNDTTSAYHYERNYNSNKKIAEVKTLIYDTLTRKYLPQTRKVITYDGSGNRGEVVEYSGYNDTTKNWDLKTRRTVFTYVHINTLHAIVKTQKSAIKPVMVVQDHKIQFFSPDILGLTVFTTMGRRVVSVRQSAASSINCNLLDSKGNLCTGKYFVELECGSGNYLYSIIIGRK